MRILSWLLLLFFGLSAGAQDLTGIWRGTFQSSDGISNLLNYADRYKFEIQLNQTNKKFEGVTYSYKTTVFYGKATAVGTVNPATGKVMLQEMKLVEVKMQQSSFACVQTFFMQYSKNGSVETLEGKYTSFRQDDSSICDRGTVSLVRVTNSDFYKEPFLTKKNNEKKDTETVKKNPPATAKITKPAPAPPATNPRRQPAPVKPKPGSPVASNKNAKTPEKTSTAKRSVSPPPTLESRPLSETRVPDLPKEDSSKPNLALSKKLPSLAVPKVLTTRENELVKTLLVTSPSVSVNIYDNGTIDHDTVSVFLDKKLVISKQMLTTSPINIKFNFEEDDAEHELVLVAENLGDIPPNTSLMVVRAGNQEFEVRITSTEQRNAVVKFKYNKQK